MINITLKINRLYFNYKITKGYHTSQSRKTCV